MTELDTYLAQHYLNEAQLTAVAALGPGELEELIRGRLVPAPSYVVTDGGTVRSFVFGEMAAPGAMPGSYFHRSQAVWIARARSVAGAGGDAAAHDVEAVLKAQFTASFAAALAAFNLATWRLPDSFDDAGAPLAEGLRKRTDSAWTYFLNGTFGLCVANPVSEAHIAYKEVLQEKLVQLSDNGARTAFTADQARALAQLIADYAGAAMPFSPVEYPVSSRKRLVDDLRARLHGA